MLRGFLIAAGVVACFLLLLAGFYAVDGPPVESEKEKQGEVYAARIISEVERVEQKAERAEAELPAKLEEARSKLTSLGGVIEKHRKHMAETKVAISQLNDQILQAEKSLDVQLAELDKLRQLEENADTEYVLVKTTTGSVKYSVSQLSNEIDRRTGTFQRGQKGLELKREGLEIGQKKYAELEEQVRQLVSVKEELELRIQELESKAATLR